MECRKEHEQLIVMMGPTKRLDRLGMVVKEAPGPTLKSGMGVLNVSVGTDLVFSALSLQVADVTDYKGYEYLGFCRKLRTMNIYRRYKFSLSRECVIGWGM